MGIASFLTNLICNDFADDDSEAQPTSESTTPDEKSDIINPGVVSTVILPNLNAPDELETSIPDKVYVAE